MVLAVAVVVVVVVAVAIDEPVLVVAAWPVADVKGGNDDNDNDYITLERAYLATA